MKYFYPLLSLLALISCKNSVEESPATPPQDSVTVISFSAFDEQAFKELSLPFKIDTLFIQSLDTTDRISFQQLRSLKANFLASEFPLSVEYEINSFCEIDSLKFHGKYSDYLEKLDIGMTKISIAYKIGFIKLNDSLRLFLWGISQSSYEACPYFSGTTIVGTFVNTANESTHVLLGEISSAGDPPATGSEEAVSEITKNKITIKGKSVSDDLDIPGEEVTLQSVIIDLSSRPRFVEPFKKVSNTEEVKEQD